MPYGSVRKKPALVLGLLAVCLGLSLAAAMPQAGSARQSASLLLDWTPNTNHTGIYVAMAKGWYTAEGLDLKLLTPGSGGSVEQLVAAGKVDFGVSFQEWVTNARIAGLPLVSLAAVIQHNTTSFSSVKSKSIKRPRDFEGKTYGGYGTPMEAAILKGLMAADGADFSKVKQVTIGEGDLLVMLQREIDLAWLYYGWQGIEAGLRKISLNNLMLKDYAKYVPDYYTPLLITNQTHLDKKSDLIRRFMRATARGYAYAIAHPAESAAILVKLVPEIKPELAKASQAWLSPRYQDDAARWGEQKAKVWQRYADWMFENKLIAKKIDMSKAFTNKYLP